MISKPVADNKMKSLVEKTEQYLQKIYEGGGKKAIARQKERNKLTARERIHYLIDKNSDFIEIGAFAGFEMYPEQGGCPAVEQSVVLDMLVVDNV